MKEQHHIDDSAPLYDGHFIGTHNSYSAFEDGYRDFLNQKYGIVDQLNAGLRVINLDLHPPVDSYDEWMEVCHLPLRQVSVVELANRNDILTRSLGTSTAG
jgi:hypothetical protein